MLYAKLTSVDGHFEDNLSGLVKGTSYSVHSFRLFYGFDYGQWIENGYVRLIMLTQFFTVLFSIYLTISLLKKASLLNEQSTRPSDFALEIIVSDKDRFNNNRDFQKEFEKELIERWRYLCPENIEPQQIIAYTDFTFDIYGLMNEMKDVIQLEHEISAAEQ